MSCAEQPVPGCLVESSNAEALAAKPGQPLAKRLIATFFTTAFLIVLTTSAILYWATVETLQYADDQVVDKRAGTVIDILQAKELNDGLLAHEVNEDNQGPRQIFIRVLSAYEPIQLETVGMDAVLGATLFPVPLKITSLVPVRGTIILPDGRTYRASSYRLGVTAKPESGGAILQVATDTSLDADSLALFQKILLLVISAALPLCALSAWYVVNRSLKPLARIASAAQTIDGGKLDKRIALTGLPAELHELAVHFNSMLSRLESTWADLRHYADTIAHEMRTPLNRMRLECEIALDRAETVDEFRDVLGSAVGECQRLSRLLQGLLFLARVDSKQAAISPRQIFLQSHLNVIREYFESEAAEAGIDLSAECASDLTMDGDYDLMQQAVTNLVSNAIASTPRGGKVLIQARRSESGVEIAVEDTGEGIAQDDQARIFDRFYRAGQSARSRDVGHGLGLGLSITKGIVEIHDGQISLESTPGKGTRVTIRLPSHSPASAATRAITQTGATRTSPQSASEQMTA